MSLKGASEDSREYRTYVEASPVTYVTKDAPPFLLIHGDEDATVPYAQSEIMEKAMGEAGAEVKLVRVPGGGHGPRFVNPDNPPDYLGEMVRWLDRHLVS